MDKLIKLLLSQQEIYDYVCEYNKMARLYDSLTSTLVNETITKEFTGLLDPIGEKINEYHELLSSVVLKNLAEILTAELVRVGRETQ